MPTPQPAAGRKFIQFLAFAMAISFGIESLGDFEAAHKLTLVDAAHIQAAPAPKAVAVSHQGEGCPFERLRKMVEPKSVVKTAFVQRNRRVKEQSKLKHEEKTAPVLVCSLQQNPHAKAESAS